MCESNYDYFVILSNPSQLFPSLTVLHMVDLVSKDATLPPYEGIPASIQEKSKSKNVADWGFTATNNGRKILKAMLKMHLSFYFS